MKKAIQAFLILDYFFGRYTKTPPVQGACENNALGRMQFSDSFGAVIEKIL